VFTTSVAGSQPRFSKKSFVAVMPSQARERRAPADGDDGILDALVTTLPAGGTSGGPEDRARPA